MGLQTAGHLALPLSTHSRPLANHCSPVCLLTEKLIQLVFWCSTWQSDIINLVGGGELTEWLTEMEEWNRMTGRHPAACRAIPPILSSTPLTRTSRVILLTVSSRNWKINWNRRAENRAKRRKRSAELLQVGRKWKTKTNEMIEIRITRAVAEWGN